MQNLRDSNSIIGQIIDDNIRILIKRREDQIISRLNELGYYFHNEVEKMEFAKTRLTMVTHADRPQWKELYLDGDKLIASWWETISYEGNTMISGKHPDECVWFSTSK